MRFVYSQIIIVTIERPSCTSPGAPPLVDALRPIKFQRLPPHDAILVRREAVLICRRGRRLAGRSENARGASAIGAHPDGTTCWGSAVTYDVDKCADMAASASAHRIGTSTVSHRTMNCCDQTLNVERGVGGNERSNIEAELPADLE
jgi:hypothetical protein